MMSTIEERLTAGHALDTLVLIGTTKGLFTLRAGPDRDTFALSGPTFPGEEIYSTCIDHRGPQTRVFVGSVSNHWGPVLRRSDDLGERQRGVILLSPGGPEIIRAP